VAQFGINGNPKISELYGQLRIADDPVTQKNRKGWVSFAKSGPNTRTTEVFINLRDNPELDKAGFAPFAHVVEGMDAAARISDWYGELAPKGNGPESARIYQIGNSYLDRSFPKLDAVRRATVLPLTASPPAAR
jgi:homoserine O-acetyltransferase